MSTPVVGVGLWSMHASLPRPLAHRLLYEELVEDALLCEELGIDSLWLSEHHLWYDGYCPAPLLGAAKALAATSRLRVGTAVLLLPFYNPRTVADPISELDRLSGGRLSLGVAAGYRSEEFDAFGITRSERGRRLENYIAVMREMWRRVGYSPEVWMGGSSPVASELCGAAWRLPPLAPPL